MPAERAGYTVTMFLVDVSPSMGEMCTIDLPPGPNGEARTRQVTRLGWALEFVMLKVQEMIFHGRKTEQCGVILFGTRETRNLVNKENGGYEHVSEFIPIGQPNAQTMSKIKSIRPSTLIGDPIDALIVGIETQARYLARKATWTRKMTLLTDGENPMEIEDWQATVSKMNDFNIQMSIIGVDFDDESMPFHEENKPNIKRKNEDFYAHFAESLKDCVIGTAALALQECIKPDIKLTKSALMASKLRIGDIETRPEEAIQLHVKMSKCTALSRPPSMKRFAKREGLRDGMDLEGEDQEIYALLSSKSRYIVEQNGARTEDDEILEDDTPGEDEVIVDKEELARGYKYGASFVPLESEEDFERLEPRAGIDICGFIYTKNFRRDWSMGEVQYVWADPNLPREQVGFSSIVQAMFEKTAMAVARLVGKSDPKMGVLMPRVLEDVDCFLWVQVPFADDLRKFTFRSLDQLVSKRGEMIMKHPHLPTTEQMIAMDRFVEAMDLMHSGEKDETGNRLPWFDPVQAYNPAVHRLKQALFHGAITSDLSENPLPPPHPELVKYFDPPAKVLKRAHHAIAECRSAFNVKQASPKAVKHRKDGHVEGEDEDEDVIELGEPISRLGKPVYPAAPLNNPIQRRLSNMDTESQTDEDSEDEITAIRKKPAFPTSGFQPAGEGGD